MSEVTDTTTAVAAARGSRRRLGFWVLVGVLAASGVAMAFIVLFGLAESQAFSLTWRVFIADVFLIASLAAQHVWLRRAIWVGTAVTFLLGVLVTFWPDDAYYVEYDISSGLDSVQSQRTAFGLLNDLNTAAYIMLVALVVLGFLSLGYRYLHHERLLRLIYIATFVAGLAAASSWAIEAIAQSWLDSPVQLGILILALTAAAIVIIAALVQRKAWKDREAATPDRAAPVSGLTTARLDDPELRALVRRYVDEYLEERGR